MILQERRLHHEEHEGHEDSASDICESLNFVLFVTFVVRKSFVEWAPTWAKLERVFHLPHGGEN